MDALMLVLTLLVLAIAVFAIAKKYYAPMTLILVSVAVLLVYTIVTGTSVMGSNSAGNMYIDVLEYIGSKFVSAFGSNGIVLLPIIGYAAVMNKLNSSKLLACLAIKPLKKINAPYWVGIPLVVLIGAVLRLAIDAQTGLNALFLVCIYPVLRACGLTKLTAASVIVLATTFDYGPGDSPTNMVYGNVVGGDVASFFINYQLKVYPLAILAAAIVAVLINKRADKKLLASGYKDDDDDENVSELDPKSLGIPLYYAIFPMLPLVFMIVFSEVVIEGVSMSACAAVFASLFVVMLFELINKHNFKQVIKSSSEQFLGMGEAYGTMFAMISAAQVFAGAIKLIGGFPVLTGWLAKLNIPGALLVMLVGPLATLVAIALGSSSAASTTFYPLLGDLAKVAGVSAESACIPLIMAVGPGRSLSPIAPACTIVSTTLKLDPIDMIKRNVVPLAVYWFVGSFIATVFIG